MLNFIKALTYSNLITSLSAASFCYFSILLLNLNEFTTESTSLVFFSTWFTYLFHRKTSHQIHGNPKLTNQDLWHFNYPKLSSFCILFSFLGAFISFLLLPKLVGLVVLPLCLISLAYVLGLGPKIKYIPLREVPYLKAFLISFCWGVAVCFIPLLSNSNSSIPNPIQAIALLFCFSLFVFGQVLHFDARDSELDERSGLKTLAHLFSKTALIRLSLLSYLISAICFILIVNPNLLFSISIFTGLAISFLIIQKSKKAKPDLYYSFLLEGSLAFPLLLFQFLIQSIKLEQYL